MMRYMYHTHTGEVRNVYIILVEKPEWNRQLRRPRHRRKTLLKWISGKQGGRIWTGFMWLRTGTSGGLLCRW
jgi:hypothetical protein